MTMTMNEAPAVETDETDETARVFGEQVADMMGQAPGETSRLLMLDPATLTVGANARAQVDLGRDFVASVRDHGVLQPIVGVRDDEGGVTVRLGQRRTLAAVRAGLSEVPVWVIETSGDEADRIVAQMVENDHRDAVSDRDRVAAVEQLSLLGMSAATIAKSLHRPRDEVKAALRVSKSTAARETLGTTYDSTQGPVAMSLEQAALLAEFDDDEAVMARLRAEFGAGRSGRHVAQQARQDREIEKERARAERKARREGLTVVEDYTGTDLADLVDAQGDPLTGHESCPGHAVTLWRGMVQIDPKTGDPAPTADDDEADDDEAATDEARPEPVYGWAWMRAAVCLDPEAHGHYYDGEAPGQRGQGDDETSLLSC